MEQFLSFLEEVFNFQIFNFGQGAITVLTLVLFFMLIAVFGLISRVIKKQFFKLLRKSRLEEKAIAMLARVLQVLILLVGFMIATRVLGVNLANMLEVKLYQLGETVVTPSVLLTLVLLAIVINVISRFVRSSLTNMMGTTELDEGTAFIFARMTQFLVIGIGAVIAFQHLGINLSSLAVIFGTLSVGIGFGLQNIASNFVSGLILLFERPINVGDRLIVGDIEGDVIEINVRSTTIRSIQNIHVIVPNSDFISQPVVNWSVSDAKVRVEVPIGVAYSSDVRLVEKILFEIAEAHPKVLKLPKPNILLTDFGDSSINFMIHCWISDPKIHRIVRSEINFSIVEQFREKGVEIPFPQRDLHVRSSVPLPVSEQAGNGKDA